MYKPKTKILPGTIQELFSGQEESSNLSKTRKPESLQGKVHVDQYVE